MAAEIQPPEGPSTVAGAAVPTTTTTTAATTIDPAQPDYPVAAAPPAPKRQRRPSVRLGEIGDQPATLSFDSHVRRTKHPWRLPKESSKSVKARSLTNLVNGNDNGQQEIQEHEATNNNKNSNQNGDVNLEFGQLRRKAKRATTKRVRSNWISKVDDGSAGHEGADSREEGEEGFRDFDPDLDSPLKDQSPVHSTDEFWRVGYRRTGTGRAGRVSESRENEDVGMGVDNNLLESDSKCEGVRTWLIELGLSRYAPVFEIHEVDDEVLPLLTLEDLKDMGINAVGSRRKLYSAIQKLRKGFS